MTVVPAVTIAPSGEYADREGSYDLRWGVAELTADGLYITSSLTQQSAIAKAKELGAIAVDYVDPITKAPGTIDVLPVAWMPYDQWLWAVNGWAVNHPGVIASAPPNTPPNNDLRYEVRVWAQAEGIFGIDYNGSAPSWISMGWCPMRTHAGVIAESLLRRYPTYRAAEVWGPEERPGTESTGNQVVTDRLGNTDFTYLEPFSGGEDDPSFIIDILDVMERYGLHDEEECDGPDDIVHELDSWLHTLTDGLPQRKVGMFAEDHGLASKESTNYSSRHREEE